MTARPPLSAAELEAMRARCEAASDGPWTGRTRFVGHGYVARYRIGAGDGHIRVGAIDRALSADTEFIVHARTDLPRLLDELERCRKLLRALPLSPQFTDNEGDNRCFYCSCFLDEGHFADCPWVTVQDYLRAVRGAKN